MASVVDSVPHLVRTANDPRQTGLYDVTLSRIEQVNSRIRLLRLSLPRDGLPFRHLPGQWLDVHIPSVPQAGGFTITSPPSTARLSVPPSPPLAPLPHSANQDGPETTPYIELAIQSSSNPPAAYLFQPTSSILHTPLRVRVGGAFVYPPPTLSLPECRAIRRAVFVAGGVGVNPVMSMVSAMHSLGPVGRSPGGRVGGMVASVRVLYSVRRMPRTEDGKEDGEVLFYKRMRGIAERYARSKEVDFRFVLHETGRTGVDAADAVEDGLVESKSVERKFRRIEHADLLECMGPEEERGNTVVYVCGPPRMTDEFVEVFRRAAEMEEKRVLCEKWW